MRKPANETSRTRIRRGLSALLLLPLLLVLSGCFRLDLGLTITEDETVDVSMEVGDLTGMLTRQDMDCADLESELGTSPDEVDFTVEEIEDEDGNVGCRMAADGAPIASMTGEGVNIERVDDTFVFVFDGDETGMDDAGMEDMPGGMEPDVSISVTFPGEVIEADGEIDGNTVTWRGLEAFTAGGTATGAATGSLLGGGDGVPAFVWIILAVVALLAVAALIFFISRRNRGSSGSDGSAPYGGPAAPYGADAVPGQVPADPGQGVPAQAGQPTQPPAGFGPSDQVPADPGPGYPGDPQPSTADPFTTANTDAPVDRAEGSPFAPSPEPPASPETPGGQEGDQQR